MDSILKQAQEVAADCIALRRKIHRHPELADGEFETTKLIQETLGSWGIEEQPLGLPTGAMGIIRGEAGRTDERVTLLRADIDALPHAGSKRRALCLFGAGGVPCLRP